MATFVRDDVNIYLCDRSDVVHHIISYKVTSGKRNILFGSLHKFRMTLFDFWFSVTSSRSGI